MNTLKTTLGPIRGEQPASFATLTEGVGRGADAPRSPGVHRDRLSMEQPMSPSFRERRGGPDVVPARGCSSMGVGRPGRTGIAARRLIVAAWAGIAIGGSTQSVGSDRITPPDA